MSRDDDRKEPNSINKVELLGRLGRDPEVRSVGRSELCTMSLATEESWKDKKTGEWQNVTQWHTVTTFDDDHIRTADKLKKGDKVYLTGILTYRNWEDRDGNKKYFTEIQLKRWHELEFRESAPAKRDGTGGRRDDRDRDDDRGRGRDSDRDRGRDDRDSGRDRDTRGGGYTPPDDLDDEIPFARCDDAFDMLLRKRSSYRGEL